MQVIALHTNTASFKILLTLGNFAQHPREPGKPGNHNDIFPPVPPAPSGAFFFFLVVTSHSWQGDNPVLPGSPPGSKCSQGPHVGGIRHFLFFVVVFFPTAGMLSCHTPFPRLSLRSPLSRPAPDVHRLLHCGLCPALLLLGFKTCYPAK